MVKRILITLFLTLVTGPVLADRSDYLDLARQGWSYQLRTTMVGRDMSIPVHINGRDLAGASICVIGEKPHPLTSDVLEAFRDLLRHSFGKPTPMRYAGYDIRGCGSGRTVILRLYSGYPPNRALSTDLQWMNQTYALGLPEGRDYAATSPAMAQTFFGRQGQGTHIMVKQPGSGRPGALETTFYKSILVEELFQSFTFGMDILLFDRSVGFLSKLQETPFNLHRLPWSSHAFMRALVRSNPVGLCTFDLFMLHAVGRAPVDETVEPDFIDYIDAEYDRLYGLAGLTMTDPRFTTLVDPDCGAPN